MTKPAKNTSNGPVVIDDQGHVLGGGEWGQVDPDAPQVIYAVDAGVLVLGDGPKSAPSAAAGEPAGAGPTRPTAGSKAADKEKT